MSAEENTKTVQIAYGHFGRGDIPSLLENVSEDIVWVLPENKHIPFAGTHHGKNEVGEFFALVAGSTDFQQFEPREFTAQNDRVAVQGHIKATIKSTGKQADYDFVHIFTVKDGRITRFQEFADTYQVAETFKAD